MDCKFGCVDSIVYKSNVTGEWHCCNCGRYWSDDESKTVDSTWDVVPDDDDLLASGGRDVVFA